MANNQIMSYPGVLCAKTVICADDLADLKMVDIKQSL